MPLPLSSASTIASYAIHPPNPSPSFLNIELSQATHRIHLINAWGSAIRPGTRILELGCGQGTCTQALAEAIRPVSNNEEGTKTGHITALDPGPPDYGRPFTLSQAQSHLSSSPIGHLLTFHNADPISFLDANPSQTWDVAILAHCIWYFPSPDTLSGILSALRGRVSRVLIAEWALRATEPKAVAHLLAVLARATFEAHRMGSQENVQTAMSPVAIKTAAEGSGWVVEREEMVVPEEGLDDGYWETGTVVGEGFMREAEKEVADERVKAVLRSARDATVAAAEAAGGAKKVRSMDVWVATLVAK